jgi:hypothetical protein
MSMWAKYAMSIAVLVFGLATASAQGKAPAQKPWEQGVSEEARKQALALFRTANDEYGRSEYKEACDHYKEALAIWSHPRIHGNLVSCLLKLDLDREALKHVDLALKYGKEPFEPHVFDRLLENQKHLKSRLTSITVSCSMAGASVTLDGDSFLSCPGKKTQVVSVGTHKLVAEKPGFLVVTRDIVAAPGRIESMEVNPLSLEKGTKVERRWSPWMPWTVLGAGVVTLGVGFTFQWLATENMNSYDSAYADYCIEKRFDNPEALCDTTEFATFEGEGGGLLYADEVKRKNRAEWQTVVGVSAITIGAAGAITGGILAYMNQPRRVRLDEEEQRVQLVPILTPEMTGFATEWRF